MNFKHSFIIIFSLSCFEAPVFAQVQEGTPCYTPRQEYGLCINIKQCNVLVNLLRTARSNPEVKTYLRSSTCGYVNNTPLVCCPQSKSRNNLDNNVNNVNPVSTEAPKVITTEAPAVQNKLARPPQCGFNKMTHTRVVGGVPAKPDQFPWIVALGYRNSANPTTPKWLCGGTLITSKHVLTAGHCVHNRRDLYLARVGELDLYDNNDGADPEDIPLVAAKIHENYSPTQFTNDIAILTLERAPKSSRVWPICVPHEEPLRSNTFHKTSPIVAGWGALYFDGPSSSTLQYAEIPVLSIENCKRAFGNRTVIDDRILCAGWTSGEKDACQGDSGGPLMYAQFDNDNVEFYQIGVVSYGYRCAVAGYPGVYTRVTNFIDWIQRNI